MSFPIQNENIEGVSVTLVTTQRQDIFALGRLLVQGIDERFFKDPEKPILISLNGSLESGKTIIAEEGRRILIPQATLANGNKGYDEIWAGQRNGRPFEIGYIDANWALRDFRTVDGNDDYSDAGFAAESFLKNRRSPGITYVQNSGDAFSEKADICLLIQKYRYGRGPFIQKEEDGRLKSAYNHFSRERCIPWTRYISLYVRNPELRHSTQFMQALQKIAKLHRPCSEAVQPLRTVYYKGSQNPFNKKAGAGHVNDRGIQECGTLKASIKSRAAGDFFQKDRPALLQVIFALSYCDRAPAF
jgi:hypothetical protein